MRMFVGIAVGIALVLIGVWYFGVQLPKDPPPPVATVVESAVYAAKENTSQMVANASTTQPSQNDEMGDTSKNMFLTEQNTSNESHPASESTFSDSPKETLLPEPVVVNFQLFWKPFQTKSQALGFAKHLTTTSGVECQVQRTDAGFYRIFFEYADTQDRDAKISRLKNDSGLSDLNLDHS